MKTSLKLLSSPAASLRAFASRPALLVTLLLAFTAAFMFMARGANPAAATIGPNDAAPVNFVGTAPGGASATEASCVDGVNCDTFKITATGTPEDWKSTFIALDFSWTLPSTDYDFFIHKDTVNGPLTGSGINDGAPNTRDNSAIDPAATGTGDYIVHIVYFSASAADQYRGVASVQPKGTGERTATYQSGGITFSPNTTLKVPVAAQDGEPSARTDIDGNSYVGAIRGVPAGVDLWYFDLNPSSPTYDPTMRVPNYRGLPDGTTQRSEAEFGGDGGGDIDLAVGFGRPTADQPAILAYSSLTLANIPTGRSVNRGLTYEFNNAGNLTGGPPGDDRQWHEFLGTRSVYLLYRTVAPAIAQIQRSNDGGFSYGVTAAVGQLGQVGCLDVHQATGTVYASGSNGVVAVGTPSVPGQAPLASDYTIRQAATDPASVSEIFFVNKVADDGTPNGTLYVVYSNGTDIYLKSSTDKGATWKERVKVNPPADAQFATRTNLFPWMETGPTPGSVGIVWYGTANPTNDDNAQWKVYFAQSFNADGDAPTFRVAEVTEPEHVIHGSNISTGGTLGNANRNLIDYFQISFDPQGAAVVAYTDDHNDFDGHTYVARQVSGPGINGTNVPAPAEGAQLSRPPGTPLVPEADVFPPEQPGRNGEQVTDFAQDAVSGLLARIRENDPYDITSLRYDTSGTGETLAIAATIRVSDLSTLPPGTIYRASFAANAPNSVVSADRTYSYGVSDDGDQFFLQAETTTTGGTLFRYGTVVRAPDGSLTRTLVPNERADAGEFNRDDNRISIQVSVAKLNAILAAANRPLIGNGTVIAGLRAQSTTTGSGGGRSDLTRGGTQFVVRDSAFPAPAANPTPGPELPQAVAPGATPAPTPPEVELANISTRVAVGAGENTGIAGFIVRGNAPKRLMIRGIGPSLRGVSGTLQDPVITIENAAGATIADNSDWRESQQAEITATGLAPTDDREAALIVSLPGSEAGTTYTATLTGVQDGQGIGLIEIYDLGAESFADLGNISTRGSVGTGDNVLIGGMIVRDDSRKNQSQDIVVRGIGPSLSASGITNPLQDPQLVLFNAQGEPIASNDDFNTNPQGDVAGAGLAPSNARESAIRRTLAPGAYTFILRGANGGTGIGLVEAYNVGN